MLKLLEFRHLQQHSFSDCTVLLALTTCSASKEKEKSIFDRIQESSVALMESSDGVTVYVWNMQDLASLSSLQIEEGI